MKGPVKVLHLRASPFLGGPERQILRYASLSFGTPVEQIVGSFVDETEGHEFLKAAGSRGLKTAAFPSSSRQALKKLEDFLRDGHISLLCTHGYKADVLGILAGRR